MTWSSVHLLPRRVSLQHDAGAGTLLTDVEFERETFTFGAITGDPPVAPPDPGDPPPPPDPIEPVPTVPPTLYGVVVLNQSQLGRSWDFYDEDIPHWEDIKGDLTGKLYNIAIGPSLQGYVTSSTGLWYCADITAVAPAWNCIQTNAAAATATGLAGTHASIVVTDGGLFYAGWQTGAGWYPDGWYFTGTAGSVSTIMLPVVGSRVHFFSPSTHGIHVDLDGSVRMACGTAQSAGARVYTVGGGYVNFVAEWGMMVSVCEGFTTAWNYQMYSDYDPASPYIVQSQPGANAMGIDVLDATPLFNKDNGLYRGLVEIATEDAVWGSVFQIVYIGGRAIYSRSSVDEIIWVLAYKSSFPPDVFIVWSDDAFVNWHDKSGDWVVEIGAWAGASGTSSNDGNALAVVIEA